MAPLSRARSLVGAGLLALLAASCADDRAGEQLVLLRVSAPWGLSKLVPGPELSSSAAPAIDLVADSVLDHATVIERQGAKVRLRLKPEEKLSAEELAARLRFSALEKSEAVSPTEVEVTLADEAAAAFFAAGIGGVDVGPFQLVSQDAAGALMRARGDTAIDEIQIVVTSVETEWRSLLAHDVDVVPSTWESNRVRFAGVRSVRLHDYPVRSQAALYFDATDPALADPAVRRRIAAAIDPSAVATVVCEGADCDAKVARVTAEPGPVPAHLTLMTLGSESRMLLAAYVVRHQLRKIGIDLEVLPVTIEELSDPHHAQLSMSPLPVADPAFELRMFLSPGHPDGMSVTGWSNPEFDKAWAAGDLVAAQQLVDSAVLYVPLYQLRYFAVVDARFCGARPDSVSSWRWIAALRPCEPGEEP